MTSLRVVVKYLWCRPLCGRCRPTHRAQVVSLSPHVHARALHITRLKCVLNLKTVVEETTGAIGYLSTTVTSRRSSEMYSSTCSVS